MNKYNVEYINLERHKKYNIFLSIKYEDKY